MGIIFPATWSIRKPIDIGKIGTYAIQLSQCFTAFDLISLIDGLLDSPCYCSIKHHMQ